MPATRSAKATATRPAPGVRGCTNFKLRALVRRVSQHYDSAMAGVGLKTTQYSLLSHVLHQGPVGAAELAASMALSASTLSRNLRPLVDAGWIEVGPGPDARSHRISITPAGRHKRAEAQRQWHAAQTALNQRLGLPAVAALHGLIDELMPRLAPAGAEEPEPLATKVSRR
jgi:DNA-binding MarR family transcriptional regulator